MKEYTFESEIIIVANNENEAWQKMDRYVADSRGADDLYVIKETKKTKRKIKK